MDDCIQPLRRGSDNVGVSIKPRHSRPPTLLRHPGRCCYCGGVATTTDHVVPRGPVVDGACKSCNSSKGSRDPVTWVEWMLARAARGDALPAHERRLWFMLCPFSLVVEP